MIAEYLGILRGLNRDVRLYLLTIALLGFTVFGGIYPVLFNLYLLRLGYGPDFVGLVSSVVGLAFALFSLPAGMLSGRWGGRRTMIGGLGLAVLAFTVLPVAEFLLPDLRSGWLLVCVFVRTAGFALFWVNGRPFLMSSTSARERGYVYSVQAAVFPLAGFAGSVVAGLMPGFFARILNLPLDHPAPYRYPLWIVAALLVPGLAALGSMSEFTGSAQPRYKGKRGQIPLASIAILSSCVLLQAIGQGAASSFLNVYLDDALRVSTATIGGISAVAQLVSALTALGTPILARRWGNGWVFVWGSLGVALGLLPMALVPNWMAAALGFVGVMALSGITLPAINVYQMELVSLEWRTAMSGTTAMASGLSWSATSFLGGRMIEAWGYLPFYLSGAGLTVLGALLFWCCFCASGDRPGKQGGVAREEACAETTREFSEDHASNAPLSPDG
jgi:MFS family permease